MTTEEIKKGETDRLEFKREVPKKDNRYLKTVVAFANGAGGSVVFGIDDATLEVVGVPDDGLRQLEDGLASAISAACAPAIVPAFSRETVDGNRLIMAQKYYQAVGQAGKYTRLRGISDKTCMELLCQHMGNEKNRGLHLKEFAQVLPAYSPRKIQRLLNALARSGKVRVEGRTKGAKWYLIDCGLTVN